MMYGYARVSSKEQNEERQLIALREYGLSDEMIYVDKKSGRDFEREEYQKMMERIEEDDVIVVESIDRPGRNYKEILEQWRIITKERKCAIVVLDMPILDTREDRDLVNTLISDIILQLLSYVAETEREFIRKRQQEGIQAAHLRGVRFGRPRIQRPPDYAEIFETWKEGEISGREAARRIGVSPSTFQNWVRKENPMAQHPDRAHG